MARFSSFLLSVICLAAWSAAAPAQRPALTEKGDREVIRNPQIREPVPPARVGQGEGHDRNSKAGDTAPPGDPHDDIMFESDVPDWSGGKGLEEFEAAMKDRLLVWQERVAEFSVDAEKSDNADRRNAAERLEAAWRAMEQSYQKLLQVRSEDDWSKVRSDFIKNYREMARIWDQVTRTGSVGPRTKN